MEPLNSRSNLAKFNCLILYIQHYSHAQSQVHTEVYAQARRRLCNKKTGWKRICIGSLARDFHIGFDPDYEFN